jgi:hypothetical protein
LVKNTLLGKYSPNNAQVIKSRGTSWTEYVAWTGERRGVHRILVGKPEGKRLLGKPSRRYEDDIKIGLTEICWDCLDLVDMLQDRDT